MIKIKKFERNITDIVTILLSILAIYGLIISKTRYNDIYCSICLGYAICMFVTNKLIIEINKQSILGKILK